MTSGERKALAFLAGIGVLGAAARVATAPARSSPSRSERLALAGQIDAVDSARRAAGGRAGASRRPRAPRGARSASTRAVPPVPSVVPERPPAAAPSLVDVDAADLAALESLPGIGPGLARRIAADRAERGPFGALSELGRVRGVGPKLAARIAPYVTFSGTRRPSSAAVVRAP